MDIMDMLVLSSSFCTETKDIWKVVGKFLWIFKIVIPLLVIIFGMIDLGKAVVGSKDEDIKKAAKQLLYRVIAGLCIFLIPTAVSFAFTLVDNVDNDYKTCAACLDDPNNC